MKVAQGVADGSVSLAFRRWRKQDVVPGQVFTTSAGSRAGRRRRPWSTPTRSPTRRPCARAGRTPTRLRRRLAPEGETYRVELSYAGPDPRVALRSSAELDRRGRRGPGQAARAAGPRGRPRPVDAALPRADPAAPAAPRAGPGRAGRPRDGAVQDRRPQAEEPRADRLLPRRLRGLAARAGLPEPHHPPLTIRTVVIHPERPVLPGVRQFQPEQYLSSSCRSKRKCSKTLRHRDHMHLSLAKAGAKGLTSFYADLLLATRSR